MIESEEARGGIAGAERRRAEPSSERLSHLAEVDAAPSVAFNHDPAARGALWEAAMRGDAAGVRAALALRGSTEEADGVRAVPWLVSVEGLSRGSFPRALAAYA